MTYCPQQIKKKIIGGVPISLIMQKANISFQNGCAAVKHYYLAPKNRNASYIELHCSQWIVIQVSAGEGHILLGI